MHRWKCLLAILILIIVPAGFEWRGDDSYYLRLETLPTEGILYQSMYYSRGPDEENASGARGFRTGDPDLDVYLDTIGTEGLNRLIDSLKDELERMEQQSEQRPSILL